MRGRFVHLAVSRLSEPKVGYSVCLIVNRGRAATQFGQTITAIGQSIKPTLEAIG
jgi:hypothetical protein